MSTSPFEHLAKKRQAIGDLFKSAEYLTAWEVSFLRSIDSRLAKHYDISEKQQDVLNNIIKQVAERYD